MKFLNKAQATDFEQHPSAQPVAYQTSVDSIRADNTKAFRLETRTDDPVSPEVGRMWIISTQ